MTETITHIALRQLGSTIPGIFEALDGVTFSVDTEDRLIIQADHIKNTIQTKDVVKLVSNQKFKWLSRYDNVINSGGVKLYPEVIENKLASILKSPFFIYAYDDAVFGQRPVLYIEDAEVDKDNLVVKLKGLLNEYEIPSQIITMTKFVWTETGKIQRKQTAALFDTNK